MRLSMLKEPFAWDLYSDQPSVILDKKIKRTARRKYIFEYIKLLFLSLFLLPLMTLLMFFFKGKKQPKNEDFYGIGVNLDKGESQVDLINELGVKNLLIRVPLWELKRLDSYVAFAKSFGDKNILINIIQDREHIENLALFESDLEQIFEAFRGIAHEFQIGTAINRIKWGFYAPSEYLNFYEVAFKLKKARFPHITLLGPSVIDFEYHYNIATMFNTRKIYFDKLSALLYVDRRGNPQNTQFGIFNLKNKINLLFAIAKSSKKSSDTVYITEANYPIKNRQPYAPTQDKECVGIDEYCTFMLKYHAIARTSRKIARVYWHQLIAPGYGLVDNRGGKLTKMPQFHLYKEMIKG